MFNLKKKEFSYWRSDLIEGKEKILEYLLCDCKLKLKLYIKNLNGIFDEESIILDALTITWQKVKNNEFNPATLDEVKAFIYVVAKNKAIDQVRKSNSFQKYVDYSEFETINTEESDYSDIHRAIEQLNENCRSILELFYFQEIKLKEIGKKMNFSEETIKTMKYRCLKKLKEIIGNAAR